MKTKNKYEDMSVIEALKCVKNKTMLLPEIQREYVWTYPEIENLFESIVDGYPVGSCIIWKTTRTNLNKEKPNLYYFIREFKERKSKNEKAPEVFSDETDYYIVLDGQQRITSLNIALYGSFTSFKGGRGHAQENPKSWIKRELYYNLDFYSVSEDDDENPKKRFAFLSDDEVNSGNWYKVKSLLVFDDLDSYIESLIEAGYCKDTRHDLSVLFQRIHDPSGSGLIHYYCIIENEYDEALDIFVRVNSTGRKLSKSDLLFSTLIDGWENGKDKVDNLIGTMNSKGDGFSFNRDYLMRLALVLVDADTNLKIQSLTKKTIADIRANWEGIASAAECMVDSLVSVGLSNETLTSYNATMPIAYYVFKGGKLNSKDSQREVKKFLSVSMAKRLFGVASNSALNNTRNALKAIDCRRTPFTLSLFSDVTLTGGRNFNVVKDDVEYWLDHYEKGRNTYVLLALLYPNLKLSQVTFHQDHCHPYAGFDTRNIKNLGLSDSTISDWQWKRNLLPNLQFLEGGENESKNKTPLKDWVADGNSFEYRPDGVSLELKDFDEFFEARRILIKKELFGLFGLDYDEADDEADNARV
ncbi:MAG: DUF262 domain-containing protein [Ruminococcaceae bacterium]|nr:DUF262 domain-containing protein [Oscillospiraceae bacterium]